MPAPLQKLRTLVDIDLPGDEDLSALQARLHDHGVTTRHDGRTLSFEDPWNTLIRVTSAEQ